MEILLWCLSVIYFAKLRISKIYKSKIYYFSKPFFLFRWRGEEVWETSSRGCRYFSAENIDNLNSSCKEWGEAEQKIAPQGILSSATQNSP